MPIGKWQHTRSVRVLANRCLYPDGNLAIHPFTSGWTHGFVPHPYGWFTFVVEFDILVNRHGRDGERVKASNARWAHVESIANDAIII
jgi:hypothetical protein